MKKSFIWALIFLAMLVLNGNKARAEEKKDRFKASLLSLVIPGLGQYYVGSSAYAKIFITIELALWSSYYYNSTMMDASRQDYFSQASLHAGVNPSGFGTSYLNAVGAYNSSYDHNMRKMQLSVNPVLYSGNQSWTWDKEANRLRFRNLRERELDYENNIKFCIAGMVLNHFVSALHASKLVQQKDKSYSMVRINVIHRGIATTYIRSF